MQTASAMMAAKKQTKTGLTLIDYNDFRRQLVKIETQSSKENQ